MDPAESASFSGIPPIPPACESPLKFPRAILYIVQLLVTGKAHLPTL
jgi:hypothetical protein